MDYIDKGFAQVSLEEVSNVKIVVKSYSVEKSYAKWLLIKTLNLPAKLYPFVMNPYERIKREIFFTEMNIELGIVPRIILIDWIGKKIVKEYIDGSTIDLNDPSSFETIADIISKIHNNEFALGDSKYSNFLRKDSRLILVDAEQAIETENPNYMFWDLIVFLSTSLTRLIYGYSRFRGLENTIEIFLNKYFEESSKAIEVLESVRNAKYRLATYTLIPYPFNIKFISIIKERIHR